MPVLHVWAKTPKFHEEPPNRDDGEGSERGGLQNPRRANRLYFGDRTKESRFRWTCWNVSENI
jgi:hypothetical protein